MRVTVKVKGERELDREMARLRKKLGLKGGEFADFAARAVRDGVVRNTQPFGMGKKARDQGVNAVRGDLLRCFRVVQDAQKSRRGVIDSVGEAHAWHRRRRNSRGRVKRGDRKSIISTVFRAYLEKVSGRVGMSKASMMGRGDGRLKRSVPKWLRPWLKAGDAVRRKKRSGAEWKFSGDPEAVGSDRVMGVRGVNRVMSKQKRLVYGALKRDTRRMLKKAERAANRG